MGKDLLADRYGRFFELAEQLAARGHTVSGIALDYHLSGRERDEQCVTESGVAWRVVVLLPEIFNARSRYRRVLAEFHSRAPPDVVIGCSDALHAIVARHVGREVFRVPYVIDLYDNFEAYVGTSLFGLKRRFREAVGDADAVTCVSQGLWRWASALRAPNAVTQVVGNAVRPDLFYPRDKREARRMLDLPQDKSIIGTGGALMTARGIGTLYEAFTRLAPQIDVHLALAGRRDMPPPKGARVHDLGVIDHNLMPLFFNALDLGIVCNKRSLFASYCDPQKLLEMRACGLPVLAADVFLARPHRDDPHIAYFEPDDADDLAQQIGEALRLGTMSRQTVDTNMPTWADQAVRLEKLVVQLVGQHQFSH